MGDLPGWAAWLLLALVLIGAEALTLEFVLIYFALGAVVAAAVSPFVGIAGQAAVFAVSSVVLMVLTRRPLINWSGRHRKAANLEDIAGESAVVTLTSTIAPTRGRCASAGSTGPRAPRTTTIRRSRPTPSSASSRSPASRCASCRARPASNIPREAGVNIPREYQ